MKWKVISYLTVVGIFSIVLFSCYKSKNFSTDLTPQIDTAVVVQCYDQARVTGLIDEVFNDVNTVLSSLPALTGSGPSQSAPAGVVIDSAALLTITIPSLCDIQVLMDTAVSPNYIQLNYNGFSCDHSHGLLGTVYIYFYAGTSWQAMGDTIGVNISNLYVSGQTADTSTLRLNGAFYYTNYSGGSLSSLTAPGVQPIVHELFTTAGVGVGLGVVFNRDETDTATWQIQRRRTYTYTSSGQIQIQTTGYDSAGGIPNVTEWGGNRFGNSFLTSVSADTPLIALSGCNYQVSSGQIQITNPTGFTNMVYGLNASGSAASACPATGGYYYFSFNWSDPGETPYNSLRPYPFW